MALSSFGTIVLLIIAICVAVGVFAYMFTKRDDQYKDQPIVIVKTPQFVDGKIMGIEKNTFYGKDGRVGINFYPRDLTGDQQSELTQIKTIIFAPHQLSVEPKGVWSQNKNIKIIDAY